MGSKLCGELISEKKKYLIKNRTYRGDYLYIYKKKNVHMNLEYSYTLLKQDSSSLPGQGGAPRSFCLEPEKWIHSCPAFTGYRNIYPAPGIHNHENKNSKR